MSRIRGLGSEWVADQSMRAVLFDLGNTLVSYYAAADFPPILRKCLRACLDVLGPSVRVDETELFQRALALNVERADCALWPLAERLAVLFGAAASEPAVQDVLTRAFLEPIFATAVLDPDAPSVLGTLRAAGLRTAIVSNTPWGSPGYLWRAELGRHKLLAAVDATVFCDDVGYRKPHPAPFEQALRLLGVSAADAVFVGDDPRWDVAGAERAGIRPILIVRGDPKPAPDTVPVAIGLRQVLQHVLGPTADDGGRSRTT